MALTIRFDWHLTDWLSHFEWEQVDLRRETGWSVRKASDVMTGKTRYNRDVINDVAQAMNLKPYELLMTPEDAFGFRRHKNEIDREVMRLVADNRIAYKTESLDEFLPANQGNIGHGTAAQKK